MQEIRVKPFQVTSAHIFLIVFVSACAVGALLIGSFPLQLSIITIFLFAGPHNLMEFRYFAARMPVRWGKSKLFYSVGIGGVVVPHQLAPRSMTLDMPARQQVTRDHAIKSWVRVTHGRCHCTTRAMVAPAARNRSGGCEA